MAGKPDQSSAETGEIEMKRLLGGTLVMALASLASAAQTPAAEQKPAETAAKHKGKKAKHSTTGDQDTNSNHKASKKHKDSSQAAK